MPKYAVRRKPMMLTQEERAIIHACGSADEDPSTSKHHCEVVGLSPKGLQVLTRELLPPGERLDIAVNLQGRPDYCRVSGIVRQVARAADAALHVLDVEIIDDGFSAQWRLQFH